ncbi:MAG: hypothetical protein IJS90_09800 [Clostridia bacterium]|nr:hypothetical protein [Clostridia bacterium]
MFIIKKEPLDKAVHRTNKLFYDSAPQEKFPMTVRRVFHGVPEKKPKAKPFFFGVSPFRGKIQPFFAAGTDDARASISSYSILTNQYYH